MSRRKPRPQKPPPALATPEPKKERFSVLKLVLLIVTPIVVGISVPFYMYGPEVHALAPSITCAHCDNANEIHPPASKAEANTGAMFTLPVENSGAMGTTLLEHNFTFMGNLENQESQPIEIISFAEVPDNNDRVQAAIGARSKIYLTITRNEGVVYEMRHGDPGSPIAPIVKDIPYIYGHLTYRNSFGIPTTTNYCFKYIPPTKGLPEGWGACANDVLAKIGAAGSHAR